MENQNIVIGTVNDIKSSFRLRMNGVVSGSMREKGVGGYLNWGIQAPELRDMAEQYGKDYNLASALWKENVRECKILATMIMPSDRMDMELVDLWVEQTQMPEIMEYAVLNLYQYVSCASTLAYMWMASDSEMKQMGGFDLISCLFKRGCLPAERDADEFVDQATAALTGTSMLVRRAAMNSLNAYAELNSHNEVVVSGIFHNVLG